MFIKEVSIKNFRLFEANNSFIVDDLGIPDKENNGSGITIFVGENGCGKTSILDAIALPLLSYKADTIALDDFNDFSEAMEINVYSTVEFSYKGTMPKSEFKGKGFRFKAGLRTRENKSFLSSIIVNDQLFIKADGESKPADNSQDLRVKVNNPFSGIRFNENDILYLDKNRTYQTRSGTYKDTRFDRLMEDFDYKYVSNIDSILNLNFPLSQTISKSAKDKIQNQFLSDAISKFEQITGMRISLNYIDNFRPHLNSFLAVEKGNNLQLNLNDIGSGYEMFFALVYSYYLSKQSGKDLVILIDEPELHFHPKLQSDFVHFLLEISREVQIVATTHSPLFIKQILDKPDVKIRILQLVDHKPKLVNMEKSCLPYLSANEINYLAFNLPTVEFHNELYGMLQAKAIEEEEENEREHKFDSWLSSKGLEQNYYWIKEINGKVKEPVARTMQTYIRNSIHHPENQHNEKYSSDELKASIEIMANLLKKNEKTN